MKNLIILFFIFTISIFSQQKTVTGIVTDSKTGQPLPSANVYIQENRSIGTVTDSKGSFTLTGNYSTIDHLMISYVGYETKTIPLFNIDSSKELIIELESKIIPSQSVLVEGSIGKEGVTPLAFDKIKREEIQEDYIVEDIPEYLSQLPSTTFYSEGGSGIGYNYLSIRGFDQRRISVSINGIPQNDPEDHNVYWLDFPDLLASTEVIQVQRGAGSGVFGYPAIGGSINIITSNFTNEPKLSLSASYGSYNTKKFSAEYSSGLIDKKYSIYAKLSQIKSSGYRDLSWVKFNSYHLSAVRYDDRLTTQINFYGGPIEDGLAYTGLPKFAVNERDLRRANYSDWYVDTKADTFTFRKVRRPVEIENFSQPHFELLNEFQVSNDVTFNSALFMIIGKGFFDYDAYWHIYYDDYFRFEEGGYDTSYIPTNPVIRAQVENMQYGWIPRVSWKHNKGRLIVGGEFRIHRSDHWGRINYANNLPPGYEADRFYYFYNGAKDIISGFAHEEYNVNDRLSLLGEVQVAYHKYKLHNEKFVGTEFEVSDVFVNPRAGINYKLSDLQNVYFSFARVSREPRLKNYYDAAESSAGEVPQFEAITDTAGNTIGYNFDNPLVTPETMNDFEFGTSFIGKNFSITLNGFYMLFDNEIVKNGQVDRFGQPVTGNVESTVHRGVEVSATVRFLDGIEIYANATYSNNFIKEGRFYLDQNNFIDLSDNRISGFPDFLANFGLSFNKSGFYTQLTGRYVGKFYSDNYDDNLNDYLNKYPGFVSYDDNVNPAYFVADFYASYKFKAFGSLTPTKIYFEVNNVLDNLYSSYAIGKEFFPAAERHFLAGIQVGL